MGVDVVRAVQPFLFYNLFRCKDNLRTHNKAQALLLQRQRDATAVHTLACRTRDCHAVIAAPDHLARRGMNPAKRHRERHTDEETKARPDTTSPRPPAVPLGLRQWNRGTGRDISPPMTWCGTPVPRRPLDGHGAREIPPCHHRGHTMLLKPVTTARTSLDSDGSLQTVEIVGSEYQTPKNEGVT